MPDTYGGYAYGGGEYAGPPVTNSPVVEVDGGQFPTTLVEIGFGYNPGDTLVVWTNVGRDANLITTRRGRQRNLNKFDTGTMTVTLDNKSGKYSPFNASSPYYNQIKPGLPIRFSAIWNGVTYRRFTGFVESWPLTWPSANDSQVTVTAVDAMKFLNLKKATSINFYPGVILPDAPIAWWRANDPAGSTTMADSSGNGNTATLVGLDPAIPRPGLRAFQSLPLLKADTAASLDFGFNETLFRGGLPVTINAATDFTFECWYQAQSSQDDGGYLIEAQSSSSNGFALTVGTDQFGWSGPFTPTISGGSAQSGAAHHVVGTCSGVTPVLALYVDGVQVAQAQSVSGPGWSGSFNFVRIGGTFGTTFDQAVSSGNIQEVAIYKYALSATQVLAHYNAGAYPRQGETTGQRVAYLATYATVPVSLIDAGNTTVQGAADDWLKQPILTNMQNLADTEGGDLFIDAAGSLTFYNRYRTSRSPYSSVSLVLGDASAGSAIALQLPGTSGNYLSTPDSAALAFLVGDLDLRVQVNPGSWAPAATQVLEAKWVGAGNQRSFRFRLDTTGKLALAITGDGSTIAENLSTVATGLTGTAWVRVTRAFSSGTTTFYTSTDGVTWTQLGGTVVIGAATAPFGGTGPLEIGSQDNGTANLFAGQIIHAEARSSIGGTVAASFDVAAVGPTSTTIPAVTVQGGATWTVNGAAWVWILGRPEEPYRLESLTVSYDDTDVINEVTITPSGLAPQTASSATSQATYGKRTLSRQSVASNVQNALDQATFFVNTLSTALPHIDSVTVVPTDDPQMLWGPVLGSDLLTRMELIRRPKDGAGSTFDQVALIEGVQDRVTKGTWQTTWALSSTDAIKMMIFGETNFGEGVFAY